MTKRMKGITHQQNKEASITKVTRALILVETNPVTCDGLRRAFHLSEIKDSFYNWKLVRS